MKTIPAGQFKVHCLSLLDEVAKTHESIVVTKYGKPMARLVPHTNASENAENPLKGSIVFEENIIAPVEVEWDALR
jgi:prevent-host-death family protein